tara:strand:+ start:868 stop:3414 length:2547 start_codon:yes stop_codon:yes gene_type:complete
MTFSYYREPDTTELESQEAQRQRDLQSRNQAFALADIKTQITNEQTDQNVLEELGKFSKSLAETGETLLTKHIEDQTAQAHLDYANREVKDSTVLDGVSESLTNASRFANQVADDIEKEDGVGSVAAEEVRSRNPYYVAAMQRLEIQNKAANTRMALEQAKEELTIIGEDGEELTYDRITTAADQAEWIAKFKYQFIRENFANITGEAFQSLVDEPMAAALKQHSVQWATSNAAARKAERKELAQLELESVVINGSAAKVVETSMNALRAKVSTREEIAANLKTMATSGALTTAMIREIEEIKIPLKGGGESTLMAQIGEAKWMEIKQAFFAKEKQDADNELTIRRNANFSAQKMLEAAMANGEAGEDNRFSESWYEAAQEEFRKEYGYRSTYLDEHKEKYAAEVPFEDDLIEKHREEIRRGTFDRRMLDRLPPRVADTLRTSLKQPVNAALAADVKTQKNILKNAVNTAVKPLPDGTQSPSALRMQEHLNQMFEEKMLVPGTTPEAAQVQTLAWFNEQLKDPDFKNQNGFPSMEAKAKQVFANEKERLAQLKQIQVDMQFKNFAEDETAYLSNKDLELKALDLQRGITDFSDRDVMVAKLLGYSHPLLMYQDFASNTKRGYKGPEMDIPPIIQVAEDTFSQESKNLLFNNTSRNRALRSLTSEGVISNSSLPMRGAMQGDFSEADSYGAGWGALSRVIRYAEGTSGNAGYNTMFTHKRFDGFGDHPRQLQSSGSLTSDAAGAYQFLSTTWDSARNSLGLQDFSPTSQEAGARHLTQKIRGVNPDRVIESIDEFRQVMDKLAPEWASLPYSKPSPRGFGNGSSYYGQGGKSIEELWEIYQQSISRTPR